MKYQGIIENVKIVQITLRGLNNISDNCICYSLTVVMSGWKLQCYVCSETVSTIKVNKEYYLMHLVAVHNIQQQVDRLLQWVLAQQGVGLVPASVAVQRSGKVTVLLNVSLNLLLITSVLIYRDTVTTG